MIGLHAAAALGKLLHVVKFELEHRRDLQGRVELGPM